MPSMNICKHEQPKSMCSAIIKPSHKSGVRLGTWISYRLCRISWCGKTVTIVRPHLFITLLPFAYLVFVRQVICRFLHYLHFLNYTDYSVEWQDDCAWRVGRAWKEVVIAYTDILIRFESGWPMYNSQKGKSSWYISSVCL